MNIRLLRTYHPAYPGFPEHSSLLPASVPSVLRSPPPVLIIWMPALPDPHRITVLPNLHHLLRVHQNLPDSPQGLHIRKSAEFRLRSLLHLKSVQTIHSHPVNLLYMHQCSSRLFRSHHRRMQQYLLPGRMYLILPEALPVYTAHLPIPVPILRQHLPRLLFGMPRFRFPARFPLPDPFPLLFQIPSQSRFLLPASSLLLPTDHYLLMQPPVYIPVHRPRVHRICLLKILRSLPVLYIRIPLQYLSHPDSPQSVLRRTGLR